MRPDRMIARAPSSSAWSYAEGVGLVAADEDPGDVQFVDDVGVHVGVALQQAALTVTSWSMYEIRARAASSHSEEGVR